MHKRHRALYDAVDGADVSQRLDLRRCKVTWVDRSALMPLLASMRWLKIGRKSLCAIRWPVPSLQHLELHGVMLGEVMMDIPTTLTSLRLVRVRASGVEPDALREWIRTLRVSVLHFEETQLGNTLTSAIADEIGGDIQVTFVKVNKTITSIHRNHTYDESCHLRIWRLPARYSRIRVRSPSPEQSRGSRGSAM